MISFHQLRTDTMQKPVLYGWRTGKHSIDKAVHSEMCGDHGVDRIRAEVGYITDQFLIAIYVAGTFLGWRPCQNWSDHSKHGLRSCVPKDLQVNLFLGRHVGCKSTRQCLSEI